MIASMRVLVGRELLPMAEPASALSSWQRMRSAPATGRRPSWLGEAHRPASLSERQEERHWRTGKGDVAVVLVERNCPIVLGVDDDRKGGNVGTKRTADCIYEQSGAKAFALLAFSDGQAADPYRRNERIAGQLLGHLWRDVRQRYAARRDRVVADDRILALHEREGVSQAVFVRCLNVTTNYISQLERGAKRPRGATLKLLSLIKSKGLEAILYLWHLTGPVVAASTPFRPMDQLPAAQS